MENYEILSPVRHDGDLYAIGDSITLSDSDAKALLALCAIAELRNTVTGDGSGETLPSVDGNEKKHTPNDDDEAVTGLALTLAAVFDGEPPEKKPNVDDVQKWTEDTSITAAQRDQAWKLYLAMPPEGDSAADNTTAVGSE